MVFALAVAAVVALGSFFFNPYASRQTDVVKNESGRTPDVGRMTPGVFTEAQSGKRIFTPRAWTRSATWKTCS